MPWKPSSGITAVRRRRFFFFSQFSHHRLLFPLAMSIDHVAAAHALVTQLKELVGANQFAKAQDLLAPIKVRDLWLHGPSRIPIVPFPIQPSFSSERSRDVLGPSQTNTIFGRLLSFNSLPRKTMRQNCGKICSLVRPALCFDQRLFVVCPVYPRFHPNFSLSRIFS